MRESIQALREQRAARAKDVRALMDSRDKQEWRGDDQAKYDALMADIDGLNSAIKREEQYLDLVAAESSLRLGAQDAKDNADPRNTTPKAIFATFLRHGEAGFSDAQRQAIRNTMSTTTSGEGGYTVQTEVANTILDALKLYGGMRSVAENIRTATGADMNFPTSDGTSETGELVAQNATSTNADPSFGVKSLSVYRYSSKDVAVPIELIQDSQVDIEAFVNARLRTRLGRITNTHFTTGTGSGQPNGVVTAATWNQAATGNSTTFTFAELMDAIHAVDPAYRALGNCGWMMNDATLKMLRKLKDSSNRPIFIPSYESMQLAAKPGTDMLLGYPITINQDMATPAASAKTILFGDFSFYKIRDAMDIMFFRFTDSAYAKKGQVGFLAMLRSGGNLVDVGGAVKGLQHSAT